MANIYLDFDRTIYNTDKLYDDMHFILNKYGITKEIFLKHKKEFYTEPILFNFIKLTKFICKKENISLIVVDELIQLLKNGEKYLYDDVLVFINDMKEKGFKINILTYGDLNFQLLKLSNLSICDIIDDIIISSNYKYQSNIKYEESIFIDDNPRDLIGLYLNSSKSVIRIKRKNTKYYNETIDEFKIPSYGSLIEIKKIINERMKV